MKKFLLAILLFFALPLNTFANAGISFVYINGSNVKDAKINKWYTRGIQDFHPFMKKAFEQEPLVQKCLLRNGEYFIEEAPITFFWGDNNHNGTSYAKKETISKGFATWLACQIRLTAANVLHDVIWIQDYHNANCVLNDLHRTVQTEAQKGNKIILYGYSSGSFVAYKYLLARIPYINIVELFSSANVSEEQRNFAFEHPRKNTCMSALEQELAVFSADGHLIFNNDFNSFKKHYMNLDRETCSICAPENTVIGMVNIASPLVLFYSDISDSNFQLTYYNRLLYKYILENNMFWITVNYREDPLSFPCRKNLTTEEIEYITNLSLQSDKGFIYDQSDSRGGILAMSHMHYLSTKKALSESVVKAYVNGYRNQCGNCNKQNTCSGHLRNLKLLP